MYFDGNYFLSAKGYSFQSVTYYAQLINETSVYLLAIFCFQKMGGSVFRK